MDTPPDQNFPSSESFVDCAGVRRHFKLDVRHLPNHGYAAEAREVTTSEHGGYVFKAFAEASGTMALATTRQGSPGTRPAVPHPGRGDGRDAVRTHPRPIRLGGCCR